MKERQPRKTLRARARAAGNYYTANPADLISDTERVLALAGWGDRYDPQWADAYVRLIYTADRYAYDLDVAARGLVKQRRRDMSALAGYLRKAADLLGDSGVYADIEQTVLAEVTARPDDFDEQASGDVQLASLKAMGQRRTEDLRREVDALTHLEALAKAAEVRGYRADPIHVALCHLEFIWLAAPGHEIVTHARGFDGKAVETDFTRFATYALLMFDGDPNPSPKSFMRRLEAVTNAVGNALKKRRVLKA